MPSVSCVLDGGGWFMIHDRRKLARKREMSQSSSLGERMYLLDSEGGKAMFYSSKPLLFYAPNGDNLDFSS